MNAVWRSLLTYNPEDAATPYSTPSHTLNAPYSDTHSKINDIVIHNPVSAEYAMLISQDSDRDQRSAADISKGSSLNSSLVSAYACPETPEECEHRTLDCHYAGTSYHTALCYTEAQLKTNNSHYHSVGCINHTKLAEALTKQSGSQTFGYTGAAQTFTAPAAGRYYLEVYGAQGGGVEGGGGGEGGYASGYYNLTAGQKLYIYVGGIGRDVTDGGGWNGGGNGAPGSANAYGSGGGGGTDIRTTQNASYANRIIAAGGGGGSGVYSGASVSGPICGINHGSSGGSNSTGNGVPGKGSDGSVSYYEDQNAGVDTYGGGGGGGYYGGYAEGGGSGYTDGVTEGKTQSGVQPGNGYARISWEGGEYTGASWGLVNLSEIVNPLGGYTVTTAWIAKQPVNAPIFSCGGSPLNIHICNTSCRHTAVLACNEPHHRGEHYTLGSSLSYVCYEACKDDAKHRPVTTVPSAGSGISTGGFTNVDWGFQIYYPNTGDFEQGGAHGLSALTVQRGMGFIDGMDTTEWVAKKRIQFSFSVIYCGASNTMNPYGSQHGNHANGSDNHKHTSSCVFVPANTWLNLNIAYPYYNFYIPASVPELAGASIQYESTANNAPGGESDGSLPANRLRDAQMSAKHGALKYGYTDVVGRMGNLVISDTGDWRFANLFKNAIEPIEWMEGLENIVPVVDTASKNYVLAESKDIRGLAVTAAFGQNTYGTSPWLADKLLPFSLYPGMNNISTLRKEALRPGYPFYMSVDTLALDIHSVVIVPYYYWYDSAASQVFPLDVYMNGNKPVNLFGQSEAASGHILAMDWDREYLRRNATEGDISRTQSYSSVYPSGNYLKLGTAQMLTLDERARTLIGSTSTLGISQNRGGESGALFANAAKRWHFTLGLPSSAFFVDAGENPVITAVREKYDNHSDGFVLMTAQMYALSDAGFTLEHQMEGGSSFSIGNNEYTLPPGLPPLIAVLDGKETSRDDLTIKRTH